MSVPARSCLRPVVALGALLAAPSSDAAQEDAPALGKEHLEPHLRRFQLEDGVLRGPGAEFLDEQIREHAVVLLGEYHGSRAISRFTRALIPLLDAAGCRCMGLEIGPTSARILEDQARHEDGAVAGLRAFNTAHQLPSVDGHRAVIPFFEHVGDAEFLEEAVRSDWSLFGFDQEFVHAMLPLIDRIAAGAVSENRDRVSELAAAARAAVEDCYRREREEGVRVVTSLPRAPGLVVFLEAAAGWGSAARATAADIHRSLEVYRLLGVGDWWNSNRSRIRHMKRNLHRALDELGIDLAEDRLFIKAGAVHTARGLSLLRNYELGSTLSELADLEGRESLHLCFFSRYTIDGNRLVDGMQSDSRYEVVRDLAVPHAWTVLDLRPLKKSVYYDHVTTEPFVKELFQGHDLVILPAAEHPPVRNRD